MKNKPQMKALVVGLMLGLMASQGTFAQNTSSALNGRITDTEGRPVASATVEILHVPSNTRKTVVTDDQGRYGTQGLRVGGPYKITVTKEGFAGEAQDGVTLALGETGQLNIDLDPAMTTLESVEVVASAQSSIFASDKMGAGTELNSEMLAAMPSIKRDLQDYARLDPRISQTDKERGEISALGQNTRFNSITIDSVSTNDTFGLEANNLPTLRQPISMDAIESVQINIVNVDVTQRGYTGANINAVTKSGTNEFKGSVYGTYRDIDWVRETDDRGVVFNGFDTEESYGATFGGPLIEDRLFFFLNYDKTTISAPGPDLASGPLNRAVNGISSTQLAEVISIAQGYGLDPGNLEPGALDTGVESLLGRFDWNITDDHRAAFRFSRTEQSEAILPGFGTNFFSLSSYWYTQGKELDNYVAELFSDWNENFSTEIRASYRDYFSTPQTFARQPQIQIDFGTANMRFGTEQFRHQNVLETKTFNGFVAGNWYSGDHTVKFGADYESNEIYNLFLDSNFGVYRFGSTADFRSGLYREYLYRAATSGNVSDAAANLTLDNIGFFLQDTWTVNNNLTLTYGMRIDTPNVQDPPVFNQRFLTAFGIRNDTTIDGNDLVQPRFGFNYTFDADRPTQLRGGLGLFQGAAANVWLANPYTNNGLTIQVFGCGTGGLANCPTPRPLPFSANPDNQPRLVVGAGAPPSDVDIVASDLNQPSVWKANLAFEHELPWYGMVGSVEAIVTEVEDAVFYEHLNLGAPTRLGLDGRNMYYTNYDVGRYTAATGVFNGTARSLRNTQFREVLLARPTSKGHGENLTLSLTKPMSAESNLFWQVAYSYTDAEEVNGLTSSRAISNFASRSIFNPNEELSSRSPYVNKNRITAAMSYRHFFFSGYKSEFAMFYEGRKGKPYSWTFNNDMNGDGLAGNDLLYIPNPGQVVFTDPAEAAVFADLVAQYGLNRYAGGVVPRNEDYAPWVHNIDMRFSQELPGFFGDNKAEIWLDVLNVGNLLNKDWGLIDEVGFQANGGQARSFVNFAGFDSTGRYIYDVVPTPEQLLRRDRNAESRWALQLGFRYSF